MRGDDLKQRTKIFALNVIKLTGQFPKERVSEIICKQLLRSAMSVGANFRAACRAKSSADFIAKMGIVEEEADETIYWMEMLVESGLTERGTVKNLLDEANQLVAIVISSIRTARGNKPRS